VEYAERHKVQVRHEDGRVEILERRALVAANPWALQQAGGGAQAAHDAAAHARANAKTRAGPPEGAVRTMQEFEGRYLVEYENGGLRWVSPDEAAQLRAAHPDVGDGGAGRQTPARAKKLDSEPAAPEPEPAAPVTRPITEAPGGTSVTTDAELHAFGMPRAHLEAFQLAAQTLGLVFDVRPTNPVTPGTLAAAGFEPKDPVFKQKTAKAEDVHLGLPAHAVGSVVHYQPVEPTPEQYAAMGEKKAAAVKKLLAQRRQEYADYADKMKELVKKGSVVVDSDGVVRSAVNGLPFAGDHDLYRVYRASTGEPISPHEDELLSRFLQGLGIDVKHGSHMAWQPETPGDKAVHQAIVDRHKGGEALIRIGGSAASVAYDDTPVQPEPRKKGVEFRIQEVRDPGAGGGHDSGAPKERAGRNTLASVPPTAGPGDRTLPVTGGHGGGGGALEVKAMTPFEGRILVQHTNGALQWIDTADAGKYRVPGQAAGGNAGAQTVPAGPGRVSGPDAQTLPVGGGRPAGGVLEVKAIQAFEGRFLIQHSNGALQWVEAGDVGKYRIAGQPAGDQPGGARRGPNGTLPLPEGGVDGGRRGPNGTLPLPDAGGRRGPNGTLPLPEHGVRASAGAGQGAAQQPPTPGSAHAAQANRTYTNRSNTQFVDVDLAGDPALRRTLDRAHQATAAGGTLDQKLALLAAHVKDDIRYDMAAQERAYDTSGGRVRLGEMIEAGSVVCREKALFTHAALAEMGIRSRVVVGDVPDGNGRMAGHAWVELSDGTIIDGTWGRIFPAGQDPVAGRSRRSADTYAEPRVEVPGAQAIAASRGAAGVLASPAEMDRMRRPNHASPEDALVRPGVRAWHPDGRSAVTVEYAERHKVQVRHEDGRVEILERRALVAANPWALQQAGGGAQDPAAHARANAKTRAAQPGGRIVSMQAFEGRYFVQYENGGMRWVDPQEAAQLHAAQAHADAAAQAQRGPHVPAAAPDARTLPVVGSAPAAGGAAVEVAAIHSFEGRYLVQHKNGGMQWVDAAQVGQFRVAGGGEAPQGGRRGPNGTMPLPEDGAGARAGSRGPNGTMPLPERGVQGQGAGQAGHPVGQVQRPAVDGAHGGGHAQHVGHVAQQPATPGSRWAAQSQRVYANGSNTEFVYVDLENDAALRRTLDRAHQAAASGGSLDRKLALIAAHVKDDIRYDMAAQEQRYLQGGGQVQLGRMIEEGAVVCREKALFTHAVLAEMGIRSTVVVGSVPDGNGRMAGHAWVELPDGTIIDGTWGRIFSAGQDPVAGRTRRSASTFAEPRTELPAGQAVAASRAAAGLLATPAEMDRMRRPNHASPEEALVRPGVRAWHPDGRSGVTVEYSERHKVQVRHDDGRVEILDRGAFIAANPWALQAQPAQPAQPANHRNTRAMAAAQTMAEGQGGRIVAMHEHEGRVLVQYEGGGMRWVDADEARILKARADAPEHHELSAGPPPLVREHAPIDREAALLDRLDQLQRAGALHPDDAWQVLSATDGEAELAKILGQRAKESALLDRMIALADQRAVDGKPILDADEALRAATDSTTEAAARYVEARAQNNQRDAELGQTLEQRVVTSSSGERYVDELFDVITAGAGFAGISNELHERIENPGSKSLVVGDDNPWLSASARLGQPAGESELPGVTPGLRMADTAGSGDDRYMLAAEHARNVEINRAAQGVGVYRREIVRVEPLQPGEVPPVPGAKARVVVRTEHGEIVLYTKRADVAGGPGTGRGLVEDKPGAPGEIDGTLYRDLKARGIIIDGDQAFGPDLIQPGERVVVHGAGAAGAWAVEAARTNAAEVTWLGRMITRDDARLNATEKKYIGALYDGMAQARAELADPNLDARRKALAARRLERAMSSLEAFTFERAPGHGNLPRNQIEGAAFDGAIYEEAGGNVRRETAVVAHRSANTLERVTWDEDRQQLCIHPAGGGEPIYADRLVLAIGQDGAAPGGPAKLLENVPALEPIIDASGGMYPFPVVVGLQTPNGAVRVVGAAATSPSLRRQVTNGTAGSSVDADWVYTNLRAQASHEQVPIDSRGVVGSFRHAMLMLQQAQISRLIDLATLSAEEQADQLDLAADEHERQRLRDEARPVR
jgi:hypothetical protein